ncbi:hypothetical protein CA13_27230 [Planctomycetes bacterium CA13]|uniref:Uncharacterized protein n=2 Tax=Novipirellula herctigrandis TaxID=2527986 RepID=A0A5C5Z1L1_9BACT|nr:hypothetical protein CA13_27230 [Planctomycetes bacterium CA13]
MAGGDSQRADWPVGPIPQIEKSTAEATLFVMTLGSIVLQARTLSQFIDVAERLVRIDSITFIVRELEQIQSECRDNQAVSSLSLVN